MFVRLAALAGVPALLAASFVAASPASAAFAPAHQSCTSAQGSTATVSHSVSNKAVKKKGYKHTFQAVPAAGSKVTSLVPVSVRTQFSSPPNVPTVVSLYAPASHTQRLRVYFTPVNSSGLSIPQWCDVTV